ncbi:MAG: transglycosylase domain-containing protein [Acidobacteria bacterium]|nr:transglycosylase domain-containing protein [Acidobacteriota bacterium]
MPPWRPAARQLAAWGTASLLAAALAGAVVHSWRISRHFPTAPFPQPSRLYSRVPELALGDLCNLEELAGRLASQGYDRVQASPQPGTFCLRGERLSSVNVLSIGLRRFPTPAGWAGGQPLLVEVHAGRIVRLLLAGSPVARAALEPTLLASFYGPEVEERWPVRLSELPPHVVQAVLAAEDDGFFHHSGLSASAIVRAAWVDVRGREARQGGSTITQQLVKNLYLPRRRNLLRKTKEALLAEIVELRHDKPSILEAYLNSIYWGRSGPANLIGLGAAARAWFGKPPQELDLAQAATLAAMIRAPAEYAPPAHAAALAGRRNRVLARLAELGWAGRDEVSRAQAAPLGAVARPLEPRPCSPWFADLAAQEARRRFGIADLAGGGYQLFATLDAGEQRRAETALAAELADLSRRTGSTRRDQAARTAAKAASAAPGRQEPQPAQRGLEAALVSVDPRDGGILAYVGGSDYRRSKFDRLAQAHRQLGSAFKPVVYAAAFENGVATPATLIDDSPVAVRAGGALWEPQNYDRTFRGWVTARGALEQSLNVPTVRLAFAVGLHRIANLAGAMGLGDPPAPVPALALGAIEASPLQVARMYSTLATLGLRPTLHGLDTVRDRNGIVLPGEEMPPPRRVLPPATAYLVTSLLQGAVDHGTASAVRRQGLADPLAGKTGTTSERRDNWFAGYSADRVTVVWVGYDDDSETRFSGATAAVPMWSRFMLAVRPAGGFPGFAPPPGVLDGEAAAGAGTAIVPAALDLAAGAGAGGWTQWADGRATPLSEEPPNLDAGGGPRGVILIRLHGSLTLTSREGFRPLDDPPGRGESDDP